MPYRFLAQCVLYLLLLCAYVNADDMQPPRAPAAGSDEVRITDPPSVKPIAFTKNMGQWPDSILFRADIGQAVMWVVKDGIYYQFFKRIERADSLSSDPLSHHAAQAGIQSSPHSSERWNPNRFHEPDSILTTMVKAQFVDANSDMEIVGLDELEYTCNYFFGNDATRWRTDVPSYSGLTLKHIYPGVDITLRGRDGRLEYEPNAFSQMALDQVRVEYRGANSVVSQTDGTTLVQTRIGERAFVGAVPVAQNPTVTAVVSSAPANVWLVYSTYLGGSAPDVASGIAVDTAGNAYVTGWTHSADFPRLNAYDNTVTGNNDIFVTKLTAGGNGLVYSTFLGGNGEDDARGIAIDAARNVYITGQTSSTDFPRQHAIDNTLNGTWDAFVTKLTSNGNALTYSTYLGGSGTDVAFGIAVDATGKACVTGRTGSTDFPRLNAYDNTLGGTIDAFVTKLGVSGSSLIFSTYLGGNAADSSYAIAVNELGDVYVTGSTNSSDFPVQNGLQTTLAGGSDLFVTKLTSGGSTLDYSTYLGGAGDDIGYAIAYGGSDYVHVTGRTNSTDFPTYASTGHPYQSSLQGEADAFVVKLSHTTGASPHFTSLVYSTYLGGGSVDRGLGIAQRNGDVYVTGFTYSDNFPAVAPYQTYQVSADVFVTKLSPDGNSLTYSTFVGGNGTEWGVGVAVDNTGSAYVTGYTASTNFPIRNPYQADQQSYDAFVTKLSASTYCCEGTTGNVNFTGIVDGGDLALLVAYLTNVPGSKPTLPCPPEANVNAVGIIDGSDLALLVAYLTNAPGSKPPLPNCP